MPARRPSCLTKQQGYPQEELIMKSAALALAALGFASNIADNKGDASASVVLKYCTCMNNKMSDNETLSITAWEKTHVAERKACDKEAGWR
jgi:hypothetical protein